MKMEKVTIEIPPGYELVQTGEGKWEQRKIERKLPKTWEEFCEMNPIKDDEYFLTAGNDDGIEAFCKLPGFSRIRDPQYRDILPNKETAEAFLALMQLIQLRNFYNGDWEPDWGNENEKKIIIRNYRGRVLGGCEPTIGYVLTFKSEELRDQFLENFKDLIEIAKPLI